MAAPANTLRIAVMAGDGIGPEVMQAACAVLEVVARRHRLGLVLDPLRAGAMAYRDTGTAMSEAVFESAASADAILFGAMGWPGIHYPDGTEIAPQIDLRMRLGLYAGVRPIRSLPGVPCVLRDPRAQNIDLVILRESTEGSFAARETGVVIEDREARDTSVITRATTERLSHFAFALAARRAAQRGRPGEVRLVDKANVFRGFAFMRRVFDEVAAQHPETPAAHHLVDAMALDLVRRPWDFDVLPMENLLGDILSDLAAGLIGGLGYAPSADIGDTHAVFQPSHGTGPDIAGRGIANPTAMVLSAALMLDWLAERGAGSPWAEAAADLRRAVEHAFANGLRTAEFGGQDTAGVTRAFIAALE